jgi:hypothetical protein
VSHLIEDRFYLLVFLLSEDQGIRILDWLLVTANEQKENKIKSELGRLFLEQLSDDDT